MPMSNACKSINFLRKELQCIRLYSSENQAKRNDIYKVAAFNMQAIHNHGSPTLYRL